MPDAMVGFSHVEGEFRFGVTLTVTFNTTHKQLYSSDIIMVHWHIHFSAFTEIEKNIFLGGGFFCAMKTERLCMNANHGLRDKCQTAMRDGTSESLSRENNWQHRTHS